MIAQIILVLILIIVILIVYYLFYYHGVDCFKHKLPRERYQDIVAEFGRPSFVINSSGGAAIWKNPDFYSKIMLKDESIQHKEPKPHCDFLYSKIRVHLDDQVLSSILALSKSIYYDRLKKELTARCHFMGANVATLLLALKLAENPDKANEIYEQYDSSVLASMDKEKYQEMVSELRKLVEENQKKYADQLTNLDCQM